MRRALPLVGILLALTAARPSITPTHASPGPGPGAPFGGDDTGCVPAAAATLKCADKAAKTGAALMRTHRSYLAVVKKLTAAGTVRGMAHITGGGITENLPRVLPRGVSAVIEYGSWPVLPIFTHLQSLGNVPQDDMMRTFNMGIGMLVVVPSKKFKKAETVLDRAGEKHYPVGRIVKGERKVSYS